MSECLTFKRGKEYVTIIPVEDKCVFTFFRRFSGSLEDHKKVGKNRV